MDARQHEGHPPNDAAIDALTREFLASAEALRVRLEQFARDTKLVRSDRAADT